MKAVTWHGKRDVRVKDVRDPTIVEPTDLIVRVTSTGICGSDLHLYEVLGPFLDAGDVLGHEAMGVVEEVGPDVTVVRTGDRVVVPFNISCGTCFMCSQGCSRSARRRRCTSTEPPRSSATRNSTGRCPADRPRLLVVESDSLAGVLETVAAENRLPLVPLHGQASTGFLGRELPRYVRDGTPALYLGDWDFSGGQLERSARERIDAYAGIRLDWRRLALTQRQVERYGLPVGRQKWDARTRSDHDAVETEALDPRVLVPLVREALDGFARVDVDAEEQRQRDDVLRKLDAEA
jgi:hypothetical protein